MKEPPLRSDALQLDEHRKFQERFWKIQRVAWVAFAIVTIGALAGLTGAGGPLSTSTIEGNDAVILYPHVARWETADELHVTFQPKAEATERTITLAPEFAKSFQLESIQPQPLKSTTGSNGQTLVFGSPGGDGGQVSMHIRAQSVGQAVFTVAIDGNTPMALTTYVLP